MDGPCVKALRRKIQTSEMALRPEIHSLLYIFHFNLSFPHLPQVRLSLGAVGKTYMVATVLAVGVGVAAAAFFVRATPLHDREAI